MIGLDRIIAKRKGGWLVYIERGGDRVKRCDMMKRMGHDVSA